MGRAPSDCGCVAAARQMAKDGLDTLAEQLRAAHHRGHHVQFTDGDELDLAECIAAAAADDDADQAQLLGRLRVLDGGR